MSETAQHEIPDARLAPAPTLRGRRRIPAVLWDATVEARGRLEAARAEADRLLACAREQAASIRAEAERRGRDEGRAGVAALHARAIVERDRLLAAAHRELADLAFAVAERVVGEVVRLHPELIVDAAARALEASRGRVEVTVRAGAADLPRLRAEVGRLQDLLGGAPRFRIVEDPALARGGVIVDTELGQVDASVEAQLDALRRAALGDDGAPA